VDDPSICQALAKKWLQENWEMEQSNPGGYQNVMAYLKISAQMALEQQAKQQLVQQSARGQNSTQGAGGQ
jgi:hypothetical protein